MGFWASQGRHAVLRGLMVVSSSSKTQVAPYFTVEEVRMSAEHEEGGGAAHGVDQGRWRERVDVMA